MNRDDALAFCRRWLPLWTGNRPESLVEVYSEDVYYRDPAKPEGIRGRANLLAYLRKLLVAFPDWAWEADDVFPIEGGFVLRWHATIPVDGAVVRETGMDLVLVRDGTIVRNEVYFDRAALLGAMSRAGAGPATAATIPSRGRFLFGRPVLHTAPSADGRREIFVLGAYPSALHVAWTPPGRAQPIIRAVAVDNEPEPFWNGDGEQDRIEAWRNAVGWRETWGSVSPCGKLNGTSGAWVEHKVLDRLDIRRSRAWITDCLDTYRQSDTARVRLGDEQMQKAIERCGLPAPDLPPHPSEDEIVAEAKQLHLARLESELERSEARRVVTLGNAPLRVFLELLEPGSRPGIRKLSPGDDYGREWFVRLRSGREVRWLPLAHPAAPRVYQERHERWLGRG